MVVHRLDRLARDLVLQEQLLAECWKMDATVSSTAAGEDAYLRDDPSDPSRRLIRQVLGAVSDYERAMVRLRLATGRRHKADAGGYAYGAPPFGYRSDGGHLVPPSCGAAGPRAHHRAAPGADEGRRDKPSPHRDGPGRGRPPAAPGEHMAPRGAGPYRQPAPVVRKQVSGCHMQRLAVEPICLRWALITALRLYLALAPVVPPTPTP